MIKTDGHGTIRKVKGGAVGVIALSTLMLGMNSVNADGLAVSTNITPTANVGSSNNNTAKEVPKNTDKEVYKKVDNINLKPVVSDAKNKGVQITEDPKPIIKDSETEANKAVNDQLNQVNEAKRLQETGDKDLNSNKEKLKASGLEIVDGGVEVFADLTKMQAFLDNQNKSTNSDIDSKKTIDNTIKLLTKELTDAGLEVTVGPKVLKSSGVEALAAIKDLQNKVITSINTKNELNKSFTNLKNLANSIGLVVKDDKVVSFNDAKSAKDFLTNQINELNALVKSLNQENSKLEDAVNTAKSKGITITKNSNSKVNSTTELTNSINQQIIKLQNLIKSVDESKSLINNATTKAKQSGLVLEGDTVVSLNKTEDAFKLKEKVQNALKDLEDATKVQASTKSEFDKLVADARAKGLDVTISGTKKVTVTGVSSELEAIKAKINKALADKNKAQSDYNSALINVRESNRLADKSSARKEGDVYKNSVTIKSEGTSGVVNIATTGSAELVSFELTDPTGAKINTVKTLADLSKFTNFSKKGNYVLNYVFRAKDNGIGKITVSGQTQGTNAVADKNIGNFKLTTKAPMMTNTENTIEPLITDHVYDYSSSYAGKVKASLLLSKRIIEANKNPDSRHIIQLYPDNYNQSSYHASTLSTVAGIRGVSSKLLTKQQALDIIDKLLKINSPSEKNPTYPNYGEFFQGLADAMGNNRYLDNTRTDVVPFEEIVDKITKPTDTISVIQYTDGWMDQGVVEVMDKSFAEWAKKRAKTFMSVINRNQVTDNDTNSYQSINQMTALGHPNIYDMTGKDPNVVNDEVVKRFMETATVRVQSVRGENQLVTVSIGGNNAKVTKAILKGPTNKDLPIVNGKVNFSEKLPDGNWTVDYELTGDGSVNVVATVAGKEVVKETKTLKATQALNGHTVSATNNIIAVTNPVLTKLNGVTIENLTITSKNVKLGQIETDYSLVSVNKEFSNVKFKETVSPISFRHTVKKAQAKLTLNDVYLRSKVLFEKGVPPVEAENKQKEVILYLDIENNSILEDGTQKELSKIAPKFLQNEKYVFTGKTEVLDGITKHYYRKVVSEKGIPEVLDLPEYHEEKGVPEVHKEEIKEVIVYVDIEDNSVLDDNTTKELPKEAPKFLQNEKYVFTGKTEVLDGITKHYYRKVVSEKGIPEVLDLPEYHEEKGVPEVHEKPVKEVILYLDIEDNSVLDDNTTKELPKEAPKFLQNEKYVFTGKTEVLDGITKHYYRKVVSEKGIPEVHEKPVKEVILYLDIEDNSILEDGTIKELSKEAPQFIRNGQYVFTGKTEVIDGITKHYYRKVVVEKPTFKPKEVKPVVKPKAVLPETAGHNNPIISLIGGSMVLGALGAVGLKKKKHI